jgi:hypothetical protein
MSANDGGGGGDVLALLADPERIAFMINQLFFVGFSVITGREVMGSAGSTSDEDDDDLLDCGASAFTGGREGNEDGSVVAAMADDEDNWLISS